MCALAHRMNAIQYTIFNAITVELILQPLLPLKRYDTLFFHRDSVVEYLVDLLSFVLRYLLTLFVAQVELSYVYQ